MLWFKSDSSGILSLPRPPSFLGVFVQAWWVKWESTEQATISVLILRNSSRRSLKANISVGQTKVLITQQSQGLVCNIYVGAKFPQVLTSPEDKRKILNIFRGIPTASGIWFLRWQQQCPPSTEQVWKLNTEKRRYNIWAKMTETRNFLCKSRPKRIFETTGAGRLENIGRSQDIEAVNGVVLEWENLQFTIEEMRDEKLNFYSTYWQLLSTVICDHPWLVCSEGKHFLRQMNSKCLPQELR